MFIFLYALYNEKQMAQVGVLTTLASRVSYVAILLLTDDNIVALSQITDYVLTGAILEVA